MRTIGDRLSEFDNAEFQTVKTFNQIFDDVPLTGYEDSDTVTIGELTSSSTTRLLTINNVAKEHSFVRRTKSEEDYIDLSDNAITDDNDPDWLFYFV
jgi:hypothetical protein